MEINKNKQELEKELLNYWYSIPNDSINPAKNPNKIKITKIDKEIIKYEKLNNQNKTIGIGAIFWKNMYYYRRQIKEHNTKKISFDPH